MFALYVLLYVFGSSLNYKEQTSPLLKQRHAVLFVAARECKI